MRSAASWYFTSAARRWVSERGGGSYEIYFAAMPKEAASALALEAEVEAAALVEDVVDSLLTLQTALPSPDSRASSSTCAAAASSASASAVSAACAVANAVAFLSASSSAAAEEMALSSAAAARSRVRCALASAAAARTCAALAVVVSLPATMRVGIDV